MKNKGGRPRITPEKKKEMLQKLEPYLKSGLSARKALGEAQIPNSTFYKIMERDDRFREQIQRFQQYLSVMLSNTIARELFGIARKQNKGEQLTKSDIKFLWWFALHSNSTREEFGRKEGVSSFDPELEAQRIKSMLDKVYGEDGNNDFSE